MQLSEETKALFKDLRNPQGDDLFELSKAPEIGEELALTHIAIMRAYNAPIPASLLSLESMLVKKGHKLIDPEDLRQSGLLGDQKA
jgi:hypothetical protein